MKLTHKCLLRGRPEVINFKLVSKMPHGRNTRFTGPYKIGPKPPGGGTSMLNKNQYLPNTYKYFDQIPQVLREIRKPSIFNKCVKHWPHNNDDLPTNRDSQPPTLTFHPTKILFPTIHLQSSPYEVTHTVH